MFDLIDDNDSKAEEEIEEEEESSRVTAFWTGISLVPVIILFSYLGKFDLGLNVYVCLCMNALAARTHWKQRKYYWFWMAIALVLAIEVPAVLLVKWPHHWGSAVALLPIAVAGYLFAAGAIRLAEKLFGDPSLTDGE